MSKLMSEYKRNKEIKMLVSMIYINGLVATELLTKIAFSCLLFV